MNAIGAERSDADVVEDVIRRRHSCRAFLEDPVPGDVLRRLFSTAQQTPSWCGTQPWQVQLLSGDKARDFADALLAHAATDPPDDFHLGAPERYVGVYQDRRRETGYALYNSVGVVKSDMEGRRRLYLQNYEFFGAPHVAVISTERDLGIYGAIDCGNYLGVFTTVAESLGLATIVQAAIAQFSPFVHQYLGLPEHRQIVCGISLGYEDRDHPINAFRTRREDIDLVVADLPVSGS